MYGFPQRAIRFAKISLYFGLVSAFHPSHKWLGFTALVINSIYKHLIMEMWENEENMRRGCHSYIKANHSENETLGLVQFLQQQKIPVDSVIEGLRQVQQTLLQTERQCFESLSPKGERFLLHSSGIPAAPQALRPSSRRPLVF